MAFLSTRKPDCDCRTGPQGTRREEGFTLVEVIMVLVILSILAITVAVKWPSGMEEDAARLHFKRAVRHAQHLALTRQFTTAAAAWGISVAGNRYTIKRADDSETADPDFVSQALPDDTAVSGGPVWFNGLGEPIDTTGALLGDTTFTIGTGSQVRVRAETGYAE